MSADDYHICSFYSRTLVSDRSVFDAFCGLRPHSCSTHTTPGVTITLYLAVIGFQTYIPVPKSIICFHDW